MTRNKDQRMVQSRFICQECGAQMVLYRKRAEQRKLGHVKHMHCPSCKETRAFTEIKDWDRNVVFWEDYQEALLTKRKQPNSGMHCGRAAPNRCCMAEWETC